MLYEPPKTKHYILIGAAAIAFVILVIAVFLLLSKNKTPQISQNNLSSQEKIQQKKTQEGFRKLEEIRNSANMKEPTPEEIQKGFAELEKQRAESNAAPPTQEQIQEGFKKLDQMKK